MAGEMGCRRSDETFCKSWPDTGWNCLAQESPVCIQASRIIEDEGILEGNNVTFHALDFRDVGYPSCSIPQTADVDYEVHG